MSERDKIEDVVQVLGHLALGTRLKRIGECLQSQTQVLIDEEGFDLPSSHFPILAALQRLGELNVGELAQAVGVSQPAISRALQGLQAQGLIRAEPSSDRRSRAVTLSSDGRRLVAKAKQSVWPRIEAAVAEACAGPPDSLLGQLDKVEAALNAEPLHLRAVRQANQKRRNARA
ncbi:MAG TPA: MarR family transcriptional regulator [Steroidobacteraceae bacterium]|jgi:DNA-binding MarR family transcriptional regulator